MRDFLSCSSTKILTNLPSFILKISIKFSLGLEQIPESLQKFCQFTVFGFDSIFQYISVLFIAIYHFIINI